MNIQKDVLIAIITLTYKTMLYENKDFSFLKITETMTIQFKGCLIYQIGIQNACGPLAQIL